MSRWIEAFCGFMLAGTVVVSGANAQSGPSAPVPTESPGEFIMDGDLYGRLVVTVTYDDGEVTEINRCPKTVHDLNNLKDLLEANRTLALGVSITSPSGTQITLEPVNIEVKPPSWLLGQVKCKMRLDSAVYISPLYALSTAGGATFTISPSVRRRDKPPEELVKLTRETVSRVMQLTSTTAPFAENVSRTAGGMLDDSGTNVTASRAKPFAFQPAGRSTELKWTTTISLDGKGTEQIPAVIVARFENIASIFSPTATRLNQLKLVEPDIILGHRLLPTTATWAGSSPTIEEELSRIAPDAYRDFLGSTTKATRNSACNLLGVALNTSGFSPTDRAVILWALAQRRGFEHGTPAGDQMACLQNRKSLLATAGVALADMPQARVITRPASITEMKAAVGSDTGDLDNLIAFFKTTDRRDAVAPSLFQYPTTLVDPDNVMLPADRRPVANSDTWLRTSRPAEAFMSNFGCYRYDASGKLFASSRTIIGEQSTDYAVELVFSTTETTREDGTKITGAASITAITLTPRRSAPKEFSCPAV